MCAIVGLWEPSLDQGHLQLVLERMSLSVAHRGPNGNGQFLDPELRVGLGHRRLAVIDLSPTGEQPMTSRSRRWTVVFNGELYNFRELRDMLMSRGTSFRGGSDTEVLVELIDSEGFIPALLRANAMFAIAAWDSQSRTLHLARDRVGEKPLYYRASNQRIAFGSELHSLRAATGGSLEVDEQSAAAFLRWSFVPHPHSIYRGVNQLAPGEAMEISFDRGRLIYSSHRWWDADSEFRAAARSRNSAPADSVQNFTSILGDAVERRLHSDVPLGAFLSGGIDSSLIAALAQQRMGSKRLNTFTVSMPDLGINEAPFARDVSHHLGTSHTEVELSAIEAIAEIEQLPSIWDEPLGDPSMLPTAIVARHARQRLTVCLGGDGGDELFAGYNRHVVGSRIDRLSRHLPGAARRAAAVLLKACPARLAAMLPGLGRVPALDDKLNKLSDMLRGEASSWDALVGVWPEADLGIAPFHPREPHAGTTSDSLDDLMMRDFLSALPDMMLTKVDRASMYVGLEVRVPFLDPEVVAWAWALPNESKTDGCNGKLILRKAAEGLLPASIVERPKLGFDPPLASWLRGSLKSWAEEILMSSQAVDRGWLSEDRLSRTWAEHVSGERNREYEIWAVLMLELWLERYRV